VSEVTCIHKFTPETCQLCSEWPLWVRHHKPFMVKDGASLEEIHRTFHSWIRETPWGVCRLQQAGVR
jgi:hypothetical protein